MSARRPDRPRMARLPARSLDLNPGAAGRSATLAIATLVAGPAAAAGFAITERDAAGLSRAFAGQAAVIAPASLSANPAALPQPLTLSASLSGLSNQLRATDAHGAPALEGQGAETTADQSTQVDAGQDALIPAAFGAWQGVGIGIDVPFGLSTRYPADWSGRSAALDSEITSARVTLGAGLQLTPALRLGAAVFAQHLSATLSNAVTLAPGHAGRVEVDGSDIGFGLGLGALWQPRDDLSLGIGYTSPVWHDLTGAASLPSALGTRADTRVKLTTPESLRLGLDWHANARWRWLAGAEWTRWSRLQSLDIELSNGLSLHEDHRWRDTWRLSLGTEHQRGPWTLRAGLAWDQSPIRDASHRYPRLPDTDRTWLAVGAGYTAGPWTLDAGLAQLIFSDRDGEHPPLTYRSDTSILALGLTRTW